MPKYSKQISISANEEDIETEISPKNSPIPTKRKVISSFAKNSKKKKTGM